MDNILKKVMTVLTGAICIANSSVADNYKPIRLEKLPDRAQSFLNTHFHGVNVALSRKEVDFLEVAYDVIFTDGGKVEFNHKGNWTEVDCNMKAVPASIVPEPVARYVKTNHQGTVIIKIERDHEDMEIELSNHVELTFNKKGRLIDMD